MGKRRTRTESVCLPRHFDCLSMVSMWHDSSRKGGEQFSLAGNKCTSLFSGPAAGKDFGSPSGRWGGRTRLRGGVIFMKRQLRSDGLFLTQRQRKEDRVLVVLGLVSRCVHWTT